MRRCDACIVGLTLTVPKNASGKRPDTSPVVSRAASQQRGQLAKGNQALQVPAVALYPSRKKVPVKDLPPFGMKKDRFLILMNCFSWFHFNLKTNFKL